jgi:glutamate racemase
MKAMPRLAIIDWGIGGISIYRLIKSRLGAIPVTYLSDTGATPYGRMSRSQLVSRLNAIIAFLRAEGVTHLVIGCNAASTVVPFLDIADLKVAGVIEPAVRLVTKIRPPRLALIGGRRTVLSGVYRRAFAERGIRVTQRIAQPLSALIESGDISSAALREQCRRILAPVKTASHVLLACTHYPAISQVLKEFVSAETIFIDPAGALVNVVERWQLSTGGRDTFLTTGDAEKMKTAAWRAFGVKLKTIRRIAI